MSEIHGWSKGKVRELWPHFELRYGSLDGPQGWDEALPVALIGPPVDGVAQVQFLVRHSGETDDAVMLAVQEIECFLTASGDADPWRYAQHHCGTPANVYSAIHWRYVLPDLTAVVDGFVDGIRPLKGLVHRSFNLDELRADTNWSWGLDDGVYCFTSGGRVEYVGRSLGSSLGARIWSHMNCRDDDDWVEFIHDREARVEVFAIEREHRHFASALEALLIDCYTPRFNCRSQ